MGFEPKVTSTSYFQYHGMHLEIKVIMLFVTIVLFIIIVLYCPIFFIQTYAAIFVSQFIHPEFYGTILNALLEMFICIYYATYLVIMNTNHCVVLCCCITVRECA